jgi:hypothetical protein
MSEKTVSVAGGTATSNDEGYDTFERLIANRVAKHKGPLFTTSATPEALWDTYLSGFPESQRQYYNCHSCRKFVQNYGGLVSIDETGKAFPLLWGWNDVPSFFLASTDHLRVLVESSKVTGIFLSSDEVWGTPVTTVTKIPGVVTTWSHLHGRPSEVFASKVQSAYQGMAEKLEDYGMLHRAVADYSHDVALQAVRVLSASVLTRSEKTHGVAEWFASIHHKNPNQRWLAVATAPVGFCHVRTTMIATLLDDILAKTPFDEISRKWAEKMNPTVYRRPTAEASEGAIVAAEKLVEKLGCAKSLERRFALLSDVLSFAWTSKPTTKNDSKNDGVFGHLKKDKSVKDIELPAVAITWEKFARTVLADDQDIEVLVPSYGNFYGLVTATHADSPAVIQWDGLEGQLRNPASIYLYNNGSYASHWKLTPGWTKVTGIFLNPSHWQDAAKFKHFGQCVCFTIAGAKDEHVRGIAMFPEIMRSEFHGISRVIEKNSNSQKLTGTAEANANGLLFGNGNPVTVRVNGNASYTIDRWD